MTRIILTLMLAFSTGLAQIRIAQADVLLIEEVRQSDRMDLPVNGMSRDEVQTRFGEPVSKHAAVGEPPITRWEYADFVVFFEYDRVIHAVLKR